MEQHIELSDEASNTYYITYKGHQAMLDKHAIVWATKQGMKALATKREEFSKKHICEHCKGPHKLPLSAEQMRVHLTHAFAEKFGGKSIGSF